ncbi:borealin-like [Centruroides sculpturatus]|uniref:borealin-like n=1 Tax=Centruroides sculpturatus TaxID=218467 RepID=UPI000C6EFAC6|nr:borealin-like [Centruroides sculpturatus]
MPVKRGRKRKVKSKSLAKDDKQLKEKEINIICSEIDRQVERRVKSMIDAHETVATSIRSIYIREISSYTKKVKAMTVKEFFNQGGKKSLNLNSVKEEIQNLSNNVSSVLRKKEEEVKGTCSVAKSKRVRKVTRKTSIKTKSITKSQTRSNNPFSTPLNSRAVFQPITPKFDPSLPTPHARKPRFGEVFLSLAGSPVTMQSQSMENKSDVVISVESGKMIMSLPEKMDEVQLDDTTKDSLMKVKNKLDKLLQC